MTETDLQANMTTAQLDKLKLEKEKIQLEINNLRRPPIFHPSAYIPVLSSLIALSGVMVNLYFTRQARNEAVVAQREAESVAKQEGIHATSLQQVLDQKQLQPSKSVNIRFRGALPREVITALQQDLVANGFVAAPPLRTPAVPQSSVTYYYPDDKALAEEVVNRATEFFAQRGCAISFQPLQPPAPAMNNKRGTIQLDVFHSCPGD
jgi:hypothetical protein